MTEAIEATLAPIPDNAAAIDFLRWWRPGGPWVVTAIGVDKKSITTGTFREQDREALTKWLQRHNGVSNCYFMVNPATKDLTKKAEREDIASLDWLHVDIDPRVGADLESERARALALLENPPNGIPRPSCVVFSGGGYQGFWRLSTPSVIGGQLTVADDLKRYNIALELALGADNCHNVDRIMRLPGTINVPDAKKLKKGRTPTLARVVWQDDTRHDIQEFTPAPVVHARAGESVVKAVTLPPVHTVDLTSLAKWKVPERVLRILQHGHDPDHQANSAKDSSRSGWVWDALCQLVRCGVPDEVITGLLLDVRFAISESVREKSNPAAYVARQLENAKLKVSTTWQETKKDGTPIRSFSNVRTSIIRMGIECHHDTFRDRLMVGGHAVQQFAGDISDDGCVMIRTLINKYDGYDPGKDLPRQAIHSLCEENRFDPVAEDLARLRWDGVPRLDRWLHTYLGAEDTVLNRVIGRKILVAAVRRVHQPGCKFDYIPVLEGEQGSGKSTSVRILAGHDDLFSDQELLHLDNKAQQEAVRGKWIYELCELGGLRRAEIERVKAFATRTHDRARRAYAVDPTDQPRRCIFIATTNDEQYLADPSGNRRFWPIKTGTIDLALLRRDRDQLFAEAVQVEATEDGLFLPAHLATVISTEQNLRREVHPWLEILRGVDSIIVGNERRVSVMQLLSGALEIKSGRQNTADYKRLVDCMRQLGWSGPKKMKFHGRAMAGFSRPLGKGPPTPLAGQEEMEV